MGVQWSTGSRGVGRNACLPKLAFVGALMAIGASTQAIPPLAFADDEAAKRQFLTGCGVCHAIEPGVPNRQGPNLLGIFGRKAAKMDGFKYSDALAGSSLVWDEATPDKWIEDAQVALPGTTMNYRQRDPDKLRLIITFLKTLKH